MDDYNTGDSLRVEQFIAAVATAPHSGDAGFVSGKRFDIYAR